MAPGSRIPDCSVVGLGAVVTGQLLESYSLFAGVPARRRRALGSGDLGLIFEKTRPDLPDEARVIDFRVCVDDQFDRLYAPIESRYTRDEVEGWLRRAGLGGTVVRPNYGWRSTGRKPER
jgi:hypothetical protein